MIRPRTDAEQRLVKAARAVAAERRLAGAGPSDAWLRVLDLVQLDAVDPVLRTESSLEHSPHTVMRVCGGIGTFS